MSSGSKSLAEHDPVLADIIEKEKARQFYGLEMIASENFTSRAVMECLGSCLTNKYAEGEVGARYYGGNQFIDQIEQLAKDRALKAFGLDPSVWAVNVQPYSGSPANFGAYTGLLQPHDRLMGLDLPSGGHLTHGFYTAKRKISATSVYFESLPYHAKSDGFIDYDELEKQAEVFRPKLIIVGASAYPRELDYTRARAVADKVGSYLLCDMAHTAGLIAGGVLKSPFEFCDVVTTTSHKSLRGPRAGMIFFRKVGLDGKLTDLEGRINSAVFPGLQGGPHEHQVAAIATQMLEVASPEWKQYVTEVQANARALGEHLTKMGYQLITGGTDNHLLVWNVRPHDLSGAKMEKVLECCEISVNKNTVVGDTSAVNPGGIRMGLCALTTRGMQVKHMEIIAGFYDRAAKIALNIQKESGKALKDFLPLVPKNEELKALRKEVEAFASQFPMPGFDAAAMKYHDGHVPE